MNKLLFSSFVRNPLSTINCLLCDCCLGSLWWELCNYQSKKDCFDTPVIIYILITTEHLLNTFWISRNQYIRGPNCSSWKPEFVFLISFILNQRNDQGFVNQTHVKAWFRREWYEEEYAGQNLLRRIHRCDEGIFVCLVSTGVDRSVI